MNIQLKPELEEIIQAQIATGKYADAEEVISKALKLLLELLPHIALLCRIYYY